MAINDFSIRLLFKSGAKISDDLYDVEPADFGGHLPAIGDRIVQMLKVGCEGYRVTDRIFETGSSNTKYVSLVVEEDPLHDLADLRRFSRGD